jgi:excisionase family DNA binding protein
METYLTIEELAAALKLAAQTIRRYVLKREIPYHKIKKVIRFKPSEVERWIESGGLDSAADRGGELEGDLFTGAETGETCRLPAANSTETGEAEETKADGETGKTEEVQA